MACPQDRISVSCTLRSQVGHQACLAFLWLLGIRTPVFMLARQSLCLLNHLPRLELSGNLKSPFGVTADMHRDALVAW